MINIYFVEILDLHTIPFFTADSVCKSFIFFHFLFLSIWHLLNSFQFKIPPSYRHRARRCPLHTFTLRGCDNENSNIRIRRPWWKNKLLPINRQYHTVALPLFDSGVHVHITGGGAPSARHRHASHGRPSAVIRITQSVSLLFLIVGPKSPFPSYERVPNGCKKKLPKPFRFGQLTDYSSHLMTFAFWSKARTAASSSAWFLAKVCSLSKAYMAFPSSFAFW